MANATRRRPTRTSTPRWISSRHKHAEPAAGQRRDGTGLHYFRARYYSSAVGRFVSADTIVPDFANSQSLNRYSYVLNSPLRFVDPTGHRACADFDQNGQCVQDPDWGPAARPDPIALSGWGRKMEQLCAAYYGGYCDFADLEGFMARGLTNEFKGMDLRRNPDVRDHLELLQHSTTHAVYMTCEGRNGGRPCSRLTRNAVLNWLGEYSASFKGLYRDFAAGTSARLVLAGPASPVAQAVAGSVFNPPHAEWKRSRGAGIDNEPVSWGNRSLWVDGDEVSRLLDQGAMWSYGLPGQDTFYVLPNWLVRELEPYRRPN